MVTDVLGHSSLLSPVKIPSPNSVRVPASMPRSAGTLLFPESPNRNPHSDPNVDTGNPLPPQDRFTAATAPVGERRSKRFDLSHWQLDLAAIAARSASTQRETSSSPELETPTHTVFSHRRNESPQALSLNITTSQNLPVNSYFPASAHRSQPPTPENEKDSPFLDSGFPARRAHSLTQKRSTSALPKLPQSVSHGSFGPFSSPSSRDIFGSKSRPVSVLGDRTNLPNSNPTSFSRKLQSSRSQLFASHPPPSPVIGSTNASLTTLPTSKSSLNLLSPQPHAFKTRPRNNSASSGAFLEPLDEN